ncbi:MAG: hypothetical protein H8E44_06435 [Planctomycetes bacterium]|nr:hypothetical protein [Planctomycetota bacterium]MBL7039352.1 hypothetical protein [Pirellulaceae bacterium]
MTTNPHIATVLSTFLPLIICSCAQTDNELTAAAGGKKDTRPQRLENPTESATPPRKVDRETPPTPAPDAAAKQPWSVGTVRASITSEIQAYGQKLVAEKNGQIVVVTATVSHANTKPPVVSRKEVTFSCGIKGRKGMFSHQPAAIGWVHARESRTQYLMWSGMVRGRLGVVNPDSGENEIEVSREKGGQPVNFTINSSPTRIAFAFPVSKEARGPFEFKFAEIKKLLEITAK